MQILECDGMSMQPTIMSGDKVLVKEVARVKAGDILVFADPLGTKVIHRLIWIDPWGGYFETGEHGDALIKRWRAEQIKGRVVGVVRDDKIIELPVKAPTLKQRLRLFGVLTSRSLWHVRALAKRQKDS